MGDPAKCSRWTEDHLNQIAALLPIRNTLQDLPCLFVVRVIKVQVILKDQENNQLEKSIRQAIREELAGVSISGSGERVSKKEEIPSQMLDFLSGLEDAF